MAIKELKIKRVIDILQSGNEKIVVPSYQRPYMWTDKNVKQLFEDLSIGLNKLEVNYRLGNVIIHRDEENILNIVDGQQRLTTLSILLFMLGYIENNKLLNSNYNSDLSVAKIIDNKQTIEGLLKDKSQDFKDKLKKYILESCEFVYIELDDLSEAFQLFDSQNARGKSLEAYDLLKAFHLREMRNNTESEKLDCVSKWERYVDNKKINQILGVNLFRIRKWSKGENANYFTKDSIDEFKGINIDQYKSYPYLKSYLLNVGFVEDYDNNSIMKMIDRKIDFPFQINQIIINGKYFFKYVYYYAELYDELFIKNNSDFYSFYNTHSFYNGYHRQGDTFVRELYQASILSYYDKFGESDFESAYRYLFKWAYKLRLKQSSVFYSSIDKYIRENNSVFTGIRDCYNHYEIYKTDVKLEESPVREITEVLNVFK